MASILDALGLPSTGAYDSGGLGNVPQVAPLGISERTTAALQPTPTSATPLDQARVLARLSPSASTGIMDKLTGGMAGSKANPAPANKLAAFGDGFFTGLKGVNDTKASTQKAGAEAIKQKMAVLKQLFDMDSKLKDQTETSRKNDASIDATNRRTAAYEKVNTVEKTPKAVDALGQEKAIQDLLAKHPAVVKLSADDDLSPTSTRKLTPEARAALEAQRDAYQQRLEGMRTSPKGAVAADGADAGAPAESASETPLPPDAPTGLRINDPAAAMANNPDVVPDAEGTLAMARDAIGRGAPRDAVLGRLQSLGIPVPADF